MIIIIQNRFFNDVSYSKSCCSLDVNVRDFSWGGRKGEEEV
jgi:hypothetical protein